MHWILTFHLPINFYDNLLKNRQEAPGRAFFGGGYEHSYPHCKGGLQGFYEAQGISLVFSKNIPLEYSLSFLGISLRNIP